MMPKRDLPKELIEEFWSYVERLVWKTGRATADEAREETDAYRRLTERKVGDMIYHENAEDVARTIAHGIWWARVRNLLMHEHKMAAHAADNGIASYLNFADKNDFKDSLLEHDAEKVAHDIAHGVASGFEQLASTVVNAVKNGKHLEVKRKGA
ncbi:MAG: hypothetical protein HY289_13675 [Planctomycetes bacterium]|nr:hypothetical protein [Planctomycetota bacterium]